MNLSGIFILIGAIAVASVSKWVALALVAAVIVFVVWARRGDPSSSYSAESSRTAATTSIDSIESR